MATINAKDIDNEDPEHLFDSDSDSDFEILPIRRGLASTPPALMPKKVAPESPQNSPGPILKNTETVPVVLPIQEGEPVERIMRGLSSRTANTRANVKQTQAPTQESVPENIQTEPKRAKTLVVNTSERVHEESTETPVTQPEERKVRLPSKFLQNQVAYEKSKEAKTKKTAVTAPEETPVVIRSNIDTSNMRRIMVAGRMKLVPISSKTEPEKNTEERPQIDSSQNQAKYVAETRKTLVIPQIEPEDESEDEQIPNPTSNPRSGNTSGMTQTEYLESIRPCSTGSCRIKQKETQTSNGRNPRVDTQPTSNNRLTITNKMSGANYDPNLSKKLPTKYSKIVEEQIKKTVTKNISSKAEAIRFQASEGIDVKTYDVNSASLMELKRLRTQQHIKKQAEHTPIQESPAQKIMNDPSKTEKNKLISIKKMSVNNRHASSSRS